MNVYVELTDEFNRGRVRAMISSGQAVVLHGLAIMSKDGDWILREDAEATGRGTSCASPTSTRASGLAPVSRDRRWSTPPTASRPSSRLWTRSAVS